MWESFSVFIYCDSKEQSKGMKWFWASESIQLFTWWDCNIELTQIQFNEETKWIEKNRIKLDEFI